MSITIDVQCKEHPFQGDRIDLDITGLVNGIETKLSYTVDSVKVKGDIHLIFLSSTPKTKKADRESLLKEYEFEICEKISTVLVETGKWQVHLYNANLMSGF